MHYCAECEACDWMSDGYGSWRLQSARHHYERSGHRIHVQISYARIFDVVDDAGGPACDEPNE
jgi:hypothetical protein